MAKNIKIYLRRHAQSYLSPIYTELHVQLAVTIVLKKSKSSCYINYPGFLIPISNVYWKEGIRNLLKAIYIFDPAGKWPGKDGRDWLGFCGAAAWGGKLLMNYGFCRLYPPPPQPTRQCLAPTCHFSTLNYNTISRARACMPIHMIGEVSW